MLQRAAQRLVLQPQGLLQAACYSTKMPDDYSLVMKNTQKELANYAETPEKEIGLCAGVPLETFTRKVRVCCTCCWRASVSPQAHLAGCMDSTAADA
jgi:hypothetical protein